MKTTVKKIALLLCAITMAAVSSSCSKEDSYQRKIIGKWEVINTSASEDSGIVGAIWDFNSDGVCSAQIPSGDGTFFTYNYSYVVSDDTLVMTPMLVNIKIIDITNTTLILHFEMGDIEVTREYRKIK